MSSALVPEVLSTEQLSALVSHLPQGVRALSIAGEGAVFWTQLERPSDVFYDLQSHPLWQEAGLTPGMRIEAEAHVRREKELTQGSDEVTLTEIYRHLLLRMALEREGVDAATADQEASDDAEGAPSAEGAEPAAMNGEGAESVEDIEPDPKPWVAAELDAMSRQSFAFRPMVELMRAARHHGLRVLLIIDTCLTREQMRSHLKHVLGEMDAALIHEVYTSADMGKRKAGGLWYSVLAREGLAPNHVLHIGPDAAGDARSAREAGIVACHFKALPERMEHQLAQRARAAELLMPEVRRTRGLPSGSKALLAGKPEAFFAAAPDRLGYATLGPIFHGFSVFIEQQMEAMRAILPASDRLKLAFIKPEAQLAAMAYAEWTGAEAPLPMLDVSPFTATAASLRTRDDIVNLLASRLTDRNHAAVLAQCLIHEEDAMQLMSAANAATRPSVALSQLLLKNGRVHEILEAAVGLRERFYAHWRRVTGLRPGDTLVVVEMGARGSLHPQLRRMVSEELGVTLHGVSLVNGRILPGRRDSVSMVGPDWADQRLVDTITATIGPFEAMCSAGGLNVVDYTEAGEPQGHPAETPMALPEITDRIRRACIDYVQDMRDTPAKCAPRQDIRDQAMQVVAELGRLTYLPSQEELACFPAFDPEGRNVRNSLGVLAQLERDLLVRQLEWQAYDEAAGARGMLRM